MFYCLFFFYSKYTTWEELVQEGCETVKYMAPYVASADCEGSSAFCVMYKMFSMGGGLSVKQMNQMLSHKNPYIKAIGLMYLRLSSPPEGLWDWFEPLLADESVIRFHPRRETACGKLGKFCADLLREMKFQELTLPRIPVPIYKKIIEKLDSYIEDNDIDFSLPRDESDADDNDDNDERGSEQGRRSGGSRRDSRDTHGSRRRKRRRSRSRSSDSSGSDRSSRDHSRRRSSHGHHHHHHRHHHSRHSRSRSRSRSPVQRQRSPTQAGAKCEGSKKDVPVVAPPQSTMSERLAKIKAMYSVGSNGTGSPSLSSSSPGAGVDYKKDSLSSDTIVLGKFNY